MKPVVYEYPMSPLFKILSISVISIICAINVCAQGGSLPFSSDVEKCYAQQGVMRNVEL